MGVVKVGVVFYWHLLTLQNPPTKANGEVKTSQQGPIERADLSNEKIKIFRESPFTVCHAHSLQGDDSEEGEAMDETAPGFFCPSQEAEPLSETVAPLEDQDADISLVAQPHKVCECVHSGLRREMVSV